MSTFARSPRASVGAPALIAVCALLALGSAAPADARSAVDEAPPPAEEPSYSADGDAEYEEEFEPVDEPRKTLSLGVRAGGWWILFDGKFRIPDREIAGTEVSLTSDLDVDEYALAPFGEVFITTRFVSIYADYWFARQQGETTLDLDVTFDGFTFAAGVPIKARYEVETVGGRIKVSPFAFDSFELGLLVGLRYYRLFGEIESQLGPLSVTRSDAVELPIPSVGLEVRVFPGPFEIYAFAHGVYFEGELDDTYYEVGYVDGEAGVALNIGDHFAVGAAYKVLGLDYEERDDKDDRAARLEVETIQHGPFIWLRLRL